MENVKTQNAKTQNVISGNAKQAAYVEARQLHREAWWTDNRVWLAERGYTEHDGPPMGDRG